MVEIEDELKLVWELMGSKEIEAEKIVHLRHFVGKGSKETAIAAKETEMREKLLYWLLCFLKSRQQSMLSEERAI